MRTVHRPDDTNRTDTPVSRCLRHHVWMAYCGDCRDAHTARLGLPRDAGTRRS